MILITILSIGAAVLAGNKMGVLGVIVCGVAQALSYWVQRSPRHHLERRVFGDLLMRLPGIVFSLGLTIYFRSHVWFVIALLALIIGHYMEMYAVTLRHSQKVPDPPVLGSSSFSGIFALYGLLLFIVILDYCSLNGTAHHSLVGVLNFSILVTAALIVNAKALLSHRFTIQYLRDRSRA